MADKANRISRTSTLAARYCVTTAHLFLFMDATFHPMSTPIAIQIRWDFSTETFYFDPTRPLTEGQLLDTTEIWSEDDNAVVTYSTKVAGCAVAGTEFTLRLEYTKARNRHLSDPHLPWGTSTITFDTKKSTCRAVWKNDPPNRDYDGVAKGTLTPCSSVEFAEYEAVFRIRRRQSEFKRLLLNYSAVCELSGESELRALDAAHIVGVSELGEHSPKNALLLRTDLHRLFDQRLLHINANDGTVSLDNSVKRNSAYHAAIKNMRLNSKALSRVRESLIIRET